MSERTRTTTLTDVARAAGVSIATASRALNGRDEVRAETRERVFAVAERLAFRPNVLAQNLLSGRTGTVGLITSDLEGRFSIPIMMGAEDAFGAGATQIFLCDARGDTIREQHHVEALLSRRVDGLIVVGSNTNPRPSLGPGLPVPVVYAYAPSQEPGDMTVTSDNEQGGRIGVQHLIDSGRRRIAHITGEVEYDAARDRAAGALAALDAAGLPLAGDRVLNGPWNEAWGRGATRMLLENDPDVDAVFCGSDQIARGAIDVLHDLGRSVPGDVAVLGFDNWGVVTQSSRPELSSVDMQLQELGRIAAGMLFAAIADPDAVPERSASVPCRVVVRGSTMPSA